MAKPQHIDSIQIMPEHCGEDVFGGAAEMRAACDAFFRRRGLNIYGGPMGDAVGMVAVIHGTARSRSRKRKKKVDS